MCVLHKKVCVCRKAVQERGKEVYRQESGKGGMEEKRGRKWCRGREEVVPVCASNLVE